jgi:dTDP-4-amino-4,6-dideoxy-D-galactose acyltransferase
MIKKLEWDSNFFGFNIADLDSNFKFDKYIFYDYIKINNVKLIQCCIDIGNRDYINILENEQFNFIDLNLTFSLKIKDEAKIDINSKLVLEKSKVEEKESLIKIADKSFLGSRYNFCNFDINKVNDMYKIWINKSIDGKFDDECLSLKLENKVIGFITLKYHYENKSVRIGLIATTKENRFNGYGKRMINLLKNYLLEKGIFNISVSTQGGNKIAQNFYISSDFRIDNIKSWYYKSIF